MKLSRLLKTYKRHNAVKAPGPLIGVDEVEVYRGIGGCLPAYSRP